MEQSFSDGVQLCEVNGVGFLFFLSSLFGQFVCFFVTLNAAVRGNPLEHCPKTLDVIEGFLQCRLLVVVVSLKDVDQVSLKLIAYNGKLIDSTSICDTSEESDQYIFEFVQKLKTIRLCEGIKDFHPISLDTELLSTYFVEQLDSRIFVRSQKCTFGIIEDGLDVCEICTSVNDQRLLTFDEGELVAEKDLMKCDECPLQTKNPQLLKKHVRISHSKNKPYMCQKCPFSSNKYLSIMRHIDRTHERTKDETDYNEKLCALNQGTIKPYACQYVCRQCCFKTTKSVAIAKHIRRSHEVKEPYKCEFCAKSFTNSGIMNVHVRSVHLKEKRYKCQDCSYESYVKHSVTKHIKYVHGLLWYPIQDLFNQSFCN